MRGDGLNRQLGISNSIQLDVKLPSLRLTFSHLQFDCWKTTFLLAEPIFRCYVSFREGIALFTAHVIFL